MFLTIFAHGHLHVLKRVLMLYSAKERINIEEAFYEIVRHIRDNYRNPSAAATSGGEGTAAKATTQSSNDKKCCVLL